MEVNPGYKQTEVGVIPEDWDVKPLIGLITIMHGYGFQSQYFRPLGKYILTTPGHFYEDGGFRDITEKQKYYDGPLPEGYILNEGDMIVAMTEQADGLLGSAAFIPLGDKYLHNQRLGKIRILSPDVSARFLYRIFNSKTYRDKVKETAAGTKVKHTSPSKLIEIPVILPPTKAEQEAIADALSDADTLIESLEQLIAKKRNLKQGAMQELLHPKHDWIDCYIGNLLTIKHGKSQSAVVDKNGIYPILASGGQIGTANQFLYNKPSVLIGRKGTIDHPQYMDEPFWSVDTLFYSEIHAPNNAKYLFYQFCLIDWMQYNEASGVPSLNARTIEQIKLKVPKPGVQTSIAIILSDMDAEIYGLEAKLAKTRKIKQGMMQELLTGRIRLI